jgi:hypothetical protein
VPPLRSILVQLAAVLAIGAALFVVRNALQSDPTPPIALPGASGDTVVPFQLGAARTRSIDPDVNTIATAKRRRITVWTRPAGGTRRSLRRRIFNGQRIPLTFLVRSRRPGWVNVSLPVRPNLSGGWVRRRDVRFTTTATAVVVSLRRHLLELKVRHHTVFSAPVAVGRSLSPTPSGRYFVTDIVRPSNPRGFYGTYSIGLSAYSEVFTSFQGADGQVGIHGTNRPDSIGKDVSHGCIRVTNGVATRLARTLPLGAPVVIRD